MFRKTSVEVTNFYKIRDPPRKTAGMKTDSWEIL